MSGPKCLWEVTAALKQLLTFRVESLNDTVEVVERPPDEAEWKVGKGKLLVWLYDITENEHVRNYPPARRGGANGSKIEQRRSPLALNLYYLITPGHKDVPIEQEILGKGMEVLHDNALVYVRSTGEPRSLQELRITMCRLDIEELTRIWDALRQPYRLSVCYHVRVARIESTNVEQHARVLEQTTGFEERQV